jgi:hypothetical protein
MEKLYLLELFQELGEGWINKNGEGMNSIYI